MNIDNFEMRLEISIYLLLNKKINLKRAYKLNLVYIKE